MKIDLRGLNVVDRIVLLEWATENEGVLSVKAEKKVYDWLATIEAENPEFVQQVRERLTAYGGMDDDDDGDDEAPIHIPSRDKGLVGYS